MPKMSGFEVCRQLKSDPQTRDIQIIMVTALNELGDHERAADCGTDEFLTKPVNRVELITRVKSLLRVRHLKQELQRTLESMDKKSRSIAEQRNDEHTSQAGDPAGDGRLPGQRRLAAPAGSVGHRSRLRRLTEYKRLIDRPDERVSILTNGLSVILKAHRTAPVVSVRMYCRTGSIYEQEYLGSGMSHLFEHLLHGAATTTRTEEQSRTILDEIGGNTNAYHQLRRHLLLHQHRSRERPAGRSNCSATGSRGRPSPRKRSTASGASCSANWSATRTTPTRSCST